jgi:hypothetical protein
MAEYTEGEGEEGQNPTYASAKDWHDRLEAYRTAIEDKWSKQRENLDKLYSKDERADSADREYSIFWANIEVLKPAVYARPPVPVVAPRFKQDNPVASHASEVLERCLITTFERSDIDGCMREVRDEFLRYGRATAWARLSVDRNGVPKIEFDQITACDFAHDPQRSWRKVKWVAKREWLARDKLIDRFGEEIGNAVPLKRQDKDAALDKKDDKAPVWECWDAEKNTVYWVCEDCDYFLDEKPPWLDLTQFWPCPKPAYGTLVPGKLKPVPDIRQYKDQIEEINEYTARIAALSEKLRLQGFYPAGAGDLSDAIEAALKQTDNRATLVPVSSWASLGGHAPKDTIVWLPFVEALELVKGLVELRRVLIDDVYQIVGIGDILRGDTDGPRKTATEQQLKSQWGSNRIRERQGELSRFACDLTRLAGEIIAENFPPQILMEMSQAELPTQEQKQQAQAQVQQFQAMAQQAQAQGGKPPQPPPEMMKQVQKTLKTPAVEEVMGFLANDRARGFVIEIETDSTIMPDEDAEKQRRVEFTTAVGGLLREAIPAMQVMPQAAPFLGEVLKFTAAGFRAGRALDSAIDDFVEQLEQMASQPKGPSPEEIKAKGDQQRMAAELQMKQQELELKKQELAMKLQEMQAKMALEEKKAVSDMQLAEMKARHEAQLAEFKAQKEAEIAAMEAEIKQETMRAEGQMKIEQGQREFEGKLARDQEAHVQKIRQGDEAHQIKLRRDDELDRRSAAKRDDDDAAARRSERGKPKGPKVVRIRQRDKDGKPAELEVNQ